MAMSNDAKDYVEMRAPTGPPIATLPDRSPSGR